VTAWFWGVIVAAVIAVIVGVFIGWMLAMWDSRPPKPKRRPLPDSRRGAQLIDTTGLPDGYVPPSASLGPVRPRRHVCMDCSHLQDVDSSGCLAIHNRPEPWVPFDYGSIPCTGSGRTA
jgi:hypothetical protein